MACNSKITGERISELRKKKGLKQSELAQRLSVSRQIISYYETGARMPNTEDIVLLAKFFNTTTDYLLGVSDVSSTNIDLKAVCDYTGLSEEAVKTLNGKSGTLGELRTYKKSKYILDYLICVDTHFLWKANLYQEKSENFLEQCEHIKKECENYTAESAEAKIIEFIADEKVVRYAYLDAVESAKEFLDHTIRPYRDCLEKKQEILNILYRMADENEEGEPNGNDNKEE